jgi:hypothetical protein
MTRARNTAAAALAIAATGLAADSAAGAISVVRGAEQARAIELHRMHGGKLQGRTKLLVRNTGRRGTLRIRYYPRLRPGQPALAAGRRVARVRSQRRAGALSAIDLLIVLPRRDRPADLEGWLSIELCRKKCRTPPLILDVGAVGDPFKGIKFMPSALEMQIDDSEGPNHDDKKVTATVELRGPAVPALFRPQAEQWRPRILLRGKSNELHARLTELHKTSDREVAEATFALRGNLKPGAYKSEIPLTDLSADSVGLPFTVNVRDSFVWAALTVFLGALLGGFAYLASARSRRKRLLRMYVTDGLRKYRNRLAALDQYVPPIKLWDLEEYLGPTRNWYKVRWSAFPDRDGVSGVWSGIAWARSDEDLNIATDQTHALVGKLARWLAVADCVVKLHDAAGLTPSDGPDPSAPRWNATAAAVETRRLLRSLRTIEPKDEKATGNLVELARRQARWHATLARVWHMKSVVTTAVSRETPGTRKTARLEALNAIDFVRVAKEQGPEHRSEEQQIDDEEALADDQSQLEGMYTGNFIDFDPPGPLAAVRLGAISPTQAVVRLRTGPVLPQPATRWQRTKDRFVDSWVNRRLLRILVRDFGWTIATAAVVSAAYIPPFFSSTWGSAGDYATAFAAGFLGKVAINWVSLPAFRSLVPWKKSPEEQDSDAGADGRSAAAGAKTGPTRQTAIAG